MKEIFYLLSAETGPGPAENPIPKPSPELPENPPPTIPPIEQPSPTGPTPADPGSLPPRANIFRLIESAVLVSQSHKKLAGDFFPHPFATPVCKIFVMYGNLSTSFCPQ